VYSTANATDGMTWGGQTYETEDGKVAGVLSTQTTCQPEFRYLRYRGRLVGILLMYAHAVMNRWECLNLLTFDTRR
jgi:hypothetical protein